MSTTDGRGFLGEGDVLADIFNSTTGSYANAYEELGEANKFAVSSGAEVIEAVSKGRMRRGQLVASVAIAKPGEIEIVLSEVNAATLRMGLGATVSDLTQGAGSLTDSPVVAQLDKWVDIGKRNIVEAGLTVKNDAGSTPYVIGTHYVIDYRLGKIKALSSGPITAGQTLELTGTYNAVSGSRLKAGTQAQIRARLLFNGRNLVDGSDAEVEVWEAVLAPTNPIDFMSDKLVDITLKGKMVTPAGKDAPYEVRLPKLA